MGCKGCKRALPRAKMFRLARTNSSKDQTVVISFFFCYFILSFSAMKTREIQGFKSIQVFSIFLGGACFRTPPPLPPLEVYRLYCPPHALTHPLKSWLQASNLQPIKTTRRIILPTNKDGKCNDEQAVQTVETVKCNHCRLQ